MREILFLATLVFVQPALANKSTRIWQEYFPDSDCSVQECAKSVPADALEAALEKVSYFKPKALKYNWMKITDMSQHSSKKRGYLVNLKNGSVTRFYVTHGKGSGDGRGNAIRFSNINDSKMTSVGLYFTAETYTGKHGYSLKMDGVEATNSKARSRAIVIHGAKYSRPEFVKKMGRAGRSWGCPAIDDRKAASLINKLKGGSAYYIHN